MAVGYSPSSRAGLPTSTLGPANMPGAATAASNVLANSTSSYGHHVSSSAMAAGAAGAAAGGGAGGSAVHQQQAHESGGVVAASGGVGSERGQGHHHHGSPLLALYCCSKDRLPRPVLGALLDDVRALVKVGLQPQKKGSTVVCGVHITSNGTTYGAHGILPPAWPSNVCMACWAFRSFCIPHVHAIA